MGHMITVVTKRTVKVLTPTSSTETTKIIWIKKPPEVLYLSSCQVHVVALCYISLFVVCTFYMFESDFSIFSNYPY